MKYSVELAIEGTVGCAVNATVIVEADDEMGAEMIAESLWENRRFTQFRIENVDYGAPTAIEAEYVEVVAIDARPEGTP